MPAALVRRARQSARGRRPRRHRPREGAGERIARGGAGRIHVFVLSQFPPRSGPAPGKAPQPVPLPGRAWFTDVPAGGRQSARCGGPYSLKPLRERASASVGYPFSVLFVTGGPPGTAAITPRPACQPDPSAIRQDDRSREPRQSSTRNENRCRRGSCIDTNIQMGESSSIVKWRGFRCARSPPFLVACRHRACRRPVAARRPDSGERDRRYRRRGDRCPAKRFDTRCAVVLDYPDYHRMHRCLARESCGGDMSTDASCRGRRHVLNFCQV